MNTNRSITRRISRPNGRRSLDKIEAEIKLLIENCPRDNAMPSRIVKAKLDAATLLGTLRLLYV